MGWKSHWEKKKYFIVTGGGVEFHKNISPLVTWRSMEKLGQYFEML
jgi:hypothetical protein